jgi:diguanylate cyclase (GGDEF)-like protein
MQDLLIYWLAALSLIWPAVFLVVYLRRNAIGATAPPGASQEASAKIRRLMEDYQELLDLVSREVGLQGKSLDDAGRLVATHEPSVAPSLKVELTRRLSEIIAANEQLRQDLLVEQLKLSAQRAELDRARIESRIDHLTGLPNRRAFDEKIYELQLPRDRHAGDYALAIFDLDRFKTFNDAHGHAAGDAILKTIAKVLTEIRRSTDFLARIGGEEFAILVPGIKLAQGQLILERYRKAIEATTLRAGGETLYVTASFGLAVSQPSEPIAELMARADQALYVAKGSGRNRVGIHDGRKIVCAGTPCCSPPSGDDPEVITAAPELTPC